MVLRRLSAVLAFCLALLAPAFAQGSALADFAGQWIGKVTVETMGPTDFPNSVRETGFTLTPDKRGGFQLEWSTIRHDSGDPARPQETTQGTKLVFKKFARSGQRWETEGGDPAAGKPAWYARLDGATLTVVGFALLDDGKAELQTYQRTLGNDALGLSYTRVVDGLLTRRASGALSRFAQ